MLPSLAVNVFRLSGSEHKLKAGWKIIRITVYINYSKQFLHDDLGKPAPVSKTSLDFNEARDDRVGVASAGPYVGHLPHLITGLIVETLQKIIQITIIIITIIFILQNAVTVTTVKSDNKECSNRGLLRTAFQASSLFWY